MDPIAHYNQVAAATPQQKWMAIHQQSQPNQPHYASGIGGFLEKFLPVIGSVAGGALGSIVAPGVGTAAGGAGGGVLGQKIQDMLTHHNSSVGEYALQGGLGALGGIGKAAEAIGGATNAVRAGEGAGAALDALRFGGKGAAALAQEGGGGLIDSALTAANSNTAKGLGTGVAERTAGSLGKQAMLSDTGALSKGVAQNALRDMGDLRSLGYNSFERAAEHAPAVTGSNGALTVARDQLINSPAAQAIDTSNFPGMVKDIINKNVSLTDSEQSNLLNKILGNAKSTSSLKGTLGNEAQSIMDTHQLFGEGSQIGQVSPATFNNAMKDIYGLKAAPGSPAQSVLKEIGGNMKGMLNDSLASAPITDGMKTEMVNQLRYSGVSNPNLIKAVKSAQTWGDLGQIESKFVTADKVANEGAINSLRGGIPGLSQGGKPTLTGMANQAAGSAVKKITSAGGSFAEKFLSKAPQEASGVGDLLGQTVKGQLKAQIPARLVAGSVQGQQQPTDASAMADGAQGSSSDLLSSLAQGNGQADSSASSPSTPFSSDAIQRAILVDIAATGGKHINELNALYSTFGSPKAQQTLSAGDQTRHDNLNSALSALDAAESNLVSAGGAKGAIGGLAKIPFFGQYINNSGTAYEKTKLDAATQLAKAVTGNSRAPANIVQGFLASLPDVTDTPQQAKTKLQMIRSQMNAQSQRFGFTDLEQ